MGGFTFNGAISNGTGTTTFTDNSTGTVTLAGTNSYTGVTSVTGGLLNLTGAIGASTVTVSGTGTLTESSAGSIGGGTLTGLTLKSYPATTTTLAGANTYTGTTTINTGSLTLDFGSATGGPGFEGTAINTGTPGRLAGASTVNFGAGYAPVTLTVLGTSASNASSFQEFGGAATYGIGAAGVGLMNVNVQRQGARAA